MIRLAISVEGETEEDFVKEVLARHLADREILATAISLGGNIVTERVVAEMVRLLWDFDRVTSLVDFYGFRRRNAATPKELQNRIDSEVHQKMPSNRNRDHAFSYVQQYEFEGLLFADVSVFATLPVSVPVSAAQMDELRAIRSQFQTPEEINDSPDTAPSKRIGQLIRGYNKRAHGHLLAEEIGLEAIRAECPRFAAWLTRLESLAVPSG